MVRRVRYKIDETDLRTTKIRVDERSFVSWQDFMKVDRLVTARTEVASRAGIGQQVVMAALIAEDSREPLMQVAAVEKALEDLGLYRPVDQSGGIKIITVSSYTLVQRTCPRIARR